MASVFNLGTSCSVEIGAILAALSNGVLAFQISRYFHKPRSDPLCLKLLILFIWLVTVAHLALSVSVLHFTTVSEHGNSIRTNAFPISLSALVTVGAVVHSSVRAIYTYRFHRIPGCWKFPILLWTLSAYSLGSAVAYSVIEVADSTSPLERWDWVFTSHFSVAAATDVLVSISTCWCLARPSNHILKRTQRLVNRIMLRIIQTGLATSMVSICVAIMFATLRPQAIWMGLYFPLVPLYPATLLALLNGRASLTKSFESPSLECQSGEVMVISRLNFERRNNAETVPLSESDLLKKISGRDVMRAMDTEIASLTQKMVTAEVLEKSLV